MPGKVVKVLAKPGDAVKEGQGVVVIEAMKMENEMKSPKDGTIVEVNVIEGQAVDGGTRLAVVE
jgi:biotin carboxyl carrier protein